MQLPIVAIHNYSGLNKTRPWLREEPCIQRTKVISLRNYEPVLIEIRLYREHSWSSVFLQETMPGCWG